MGMHFGLVAIKAPVSEFKSAFAKAWPTFEVIASADNFSCAEAVWSWMEGHEHFVSAAAWTKETPGTQCLFLSQDGPWAVLVDPSYTLVSDEEALERLSEQYGTALAFVVETAGGCAFFWCYERGQLRRLISNTGEVVKTEGAALPEEKGIEVNDYYMDETESLMRAFGLSPVETLPIPSATIAIAVTDRTDYS